MNKTAPSINAVLANERYHHGQQRQQQQQQQQQQQNAPESESGSGSGSGSPVSPTSPTSPAPSFSWPRRVRSPEPHVPLRKASPERLHQRTKKPPLFITTNAGGHGLGPTTASSVAAPHQTRADAAHRHWWDDVEITHNRNHGGHHGPEPGQRDLHHQGSNSGHRDSEHGHHHPHLNNHNHNNNNINNHEPEHVQHYHNSRHDSEHGQRNHHHYHNNDNHDPQHAQRTHSGQHGLEHPQRQSSATDHALATHQRQPPPTDAPAPRSWPLSPPAPPPPDDGSLAARDGSSISIPDVAHDELMRTSYRSAMTSASSHMDSTIATARSSVVTADSSVSDIAKVDSSCADGHAREEDEDEDEEDGGFTVEDALDMYLGGFETPSKLSVDMRGSLDLGGSADLSAPGPDAASLRPGTSPLQHGSDANRLHRRSHSASAVDRKSIVVDVNAAGAALADVPAVPAVPADLADPASLGAGPPQLHLDITPVSEHANTSIEAISGGHDLPSSRPLSAPVPRDRYGFKKISHHITMEQYDAWEKPYNEHLERRRTKWNALMKQFGYATENPTRFPTRSEKVKRYIRKGIPPDWRGAAWFWYAGGPGKLAKNPGLYWNLLQDVRNGGLTDNDREHIERDLNRTFPDNILFKPDSSSGAKPDDETSMIKALRRVLQAFAVHNPSIGYCQSLNFIAGLLLLFLDEDEEKVFVLLNVVTSQHLPGTHGVALEGANIDIAVLMTSIKESLPSIWQKLDDKPTTPGPGGAPRLPTVSLATTAWFMSLFVGTLPIECVLRVWDCLFFEGSKTLFRVALAIFKSGEQKIKAVNDPMEIFQVVQTMPRGMLDANALMECCFKKRGGFGGLSQDVVEKRREEGREATRQGRSLTDETGSKRSLMRGKSRGRFGIKTKSAVH